MISNSTQSSPPFAGSSKADNQSGNAALEVSLLIASLTLVLLVSLRSVGEACNHAFQLMEHGEAGLTTGNGKKTH